MRITAKGAQKTRDESRKLPMYSKQWLPGDTLRVFYPIDWEDGHPEIVAGAVWGHSVSDIKGLGLKTAFIPSLTDFDENAQPIGKPDITYQFSQIARVFVDGQKAIEEAEIMQKNWPTESARKEALKAHEEKFDAKNNMKAVKPIIGKVQYYISTEVCCIKYVNNMFNSESLAVVSAPLSNQTIDRLYQIMNDPKYAPQPGERFLEVEWKYPTNADKQASAKAATPAGLTPEYRLSNVDPATWAKMQSELDKVAFDSDTIAKRATKKVDENKIRAALTQYTFLNDKYLSAAPEEDVETLCKHANVIHELDATRVISNQELLNKIMASLEEIKATEQATLPELTPQSSLADIASAAQAAPTPAQAVPTPVQPTPDLTTNVVTPAVNSPTTPVTSTPVETPAAVTDPVLNPGAPSLASLMSNPLNVSVNDDINLEEISLEQI